MQDIRIIILKLKCWGMNLLQFSQMNWIYWFNIPSKGPIMIVDIPPLKFEVSGITRLLRNINAENARGADNISLAGFWKKLVIAPFLQYIFTLSIQNRSSPKWLGHCKWHPSFQKKKSREPSNYRPTSLKIKFLSKILAARKFPTNTPPPQPITFLMVRPLISFTGVFVWL